MHPFWNSRAGQLLVGGCGTQIGMLVTCGGLIVALLFCSVCVSANLFTLSLQQEIARQPAENGPAAAPEAPATDPGLSLLLAEVDALFGQIDVLESNLAAAPAPAPAPAAPSGPPVVTASQGSANLHSGPGVDFEAIDLLPAGASLDIIGRNLESTWWLVSQANGRYAWVSGQAVIASNITDSIPVVTVPSLLGQPAASGSLVETTPTITPTATSRPTPTLPPGTPTPARSIEREFVEEMSAYQRVKAALRVPPVSASLSPDGSLIAMTERIKLYTVTTAGAHTDIWYEEDDKSGPIGWVVWSPDGEHLAFVVGFKEKNCRPCESVAVLRLSDGTLTFLEAPEDMDTDAPRWTQDGRLLVNAHPGEPADGVTYVYDVFGLGEEATGVYVLSTSHDGQMWHPWLPGRVWRAGVSERPDSYVHEK